MCVVGIIEINVRATKWWLRHVSRDGIGRCSRANEWEGDNKGALARQFAAYGLLRLAPVVVTMGFVAVERRHLMVRVSHTPPPVGISDRERSSLESRRASRAILLQVWALFAPKYMFEGCGLMLNNALLLGVATLVFSQRIS